MKYGIDMLLKQVLADGRCMEIFEKNLPGVLEQLEKQTAARDLSIRKIAQYTNGRIPKEKLDILEKELNDLNKGGSVITLEEAVRIQKYQAIAAPQQAIYPGKTWFDTNGKRIQAHAGAVYYENGIWYWYGENKEYTDGENEIWTWGIRAYTSVDLLNWEDRGLIIKPVLDNPESGLFPEQYMDRPHIIKSDLTGKYVCWIKLSGARASFVILQSDHILGPYEVMKEFYSPFGMEVGDFDIVKDSENEKVYLFMDADHSAVVGMELEGDLLSVKRIVSRQYENLNPPFCREGITLFERKGKKYMLTSGMTGYLPNKSDLAISDSWEEPFVSVGNPYEGDGTNTSFNSQVSQIFSVPGKEDTYIAIADRWLGENLLDARLADVVCRTVASHSEPEKYQVSLSEREEYRSLPGTKQTNTSVADYVWLPLDIEEEKIKIRWKNEWVPF